MIILKNPQQIESMRKLGKIHTKLLGELWDFLRPGLDVYEVEEFYTKLLKKYKKHNIKSACKGYQPSKKVPPYPTNLCISIDSECVHTYPTKGKIIKNGSLVVVDTVITDGVFYTDAAFTKFVMDSKKQNLSEKFSDFDYDIYIEKKRLNSVANLALQKGISGIKPGVRVGEISFEIYKTVREAGFDVLKEYGGHGIGLYLWEEPFIPNYGPRDYGPVLKEGMTLAIETLVVSKSDKVVNIDEWATKLSDNGYFAQWEVTVAVTSSGYKILAGDYNLLR